MFHDDFRNLNNWNVADQVPYDNTEIWFEKWAVGTTNEGVILFCQENAYEDINAKYISGRIDTRNEFMFSNGLVVVNAKICDSFCAVWLLKDDHKVEGYDRNQIIPEIDILENIRGKQRHTVHYGYWNDDTKYTRTSVGSSIFKADNKWHEYAVDCKADGYDFYVDRILTATFKSKDPEFVSDAKHYIIINNGAKSDSKSKNTEFIIKDIKVYK